MEQAVCGPGRVANAAKQSTVKNWMGKHFVYTRIARVVRFAFIPFNSSSSLFRIHADRLKTNYLLIAGVICSILGVALTKQVIDYPFDFVSHILS